MNQIRYHIMKFIDKLRHKHYNRCIYCGHKLTDREIEYYECTCNRCEGILMTKW